MSLVKPLPGSFPDPSPIRKDLVLDIPMLATGDLWNRIKPVTDKSVTNNGATWTSGQYGTALGFSGGEEYIECSSLPTIDTDFSIILCIKAGTATGDKWLYRQYVEGAGGLALWTSGTNIIFYVGGFSERVEATSGIIINTDQVITVTKKGTTLSIYIDGVLAVSGTKVITDPIAQPALIGGPSVDGVSPFNGQISYVNVTLKAFSAQEVRQITEDPWRDYEKDPIPVWAGTQGGEPPTGIPILRRRMECV